MIVIKSDGYTFVGNDDIKFKLDGRNKITNLDRICEHFGVNYSNYFNNEEVKEKGKLEFKDVLGVLKNSGDTKHLYEFTYECDHEINNKLVKDEVGKLKETIRNMNNAEDEIDISEEKEKEYEDKIDKLNDKVKSYEERMNDLREEIERMRQMINAKDNEINGRAEAARNYQEAVRRILADLRRFTNEGMEILIRAANIGELGGINDVIRRIGELGNDMQNIAQMNPNFQIINTEILNSINDSERWIRNLHRRIQRHFDNQVDMGQRIHQLRNQIRQLQNDLNDANQDYNQLLNDLGDANQRNDQLQNQINGLNFKIDLQKQVLNSLIKRYEKLYGPTITELNEKKLQCDILGRENAQLQNQINDLNFKIDHQKEDLKKRIKQHRNVALVATNTRKILDDYTKDMVSIVNKLIKIQSKGVKDDKLHGRLNELLAKWKDKKDELNGISNNAYDLVDKLNKISGVWIDNAYLAASNNNICKIDQSFENIMKYLIKCVENNKIIQKKDIKEDFNNVRENIKVLDNITKLNYTTEEAKRKMSAIIERNNNLVSCLNSLVDLINEVRKQNDEKLKTLDADIKKLNEEINKMKKSIDAKDTKLKDNEKFIKDSNVIRTKILERFRSLKKGTDKLKESIDAKNEIINILANKNTKFANENMELRKKSEQLDKDIKELTINLEKKIKDLELLKTDIKNKDDEIKELKEKYGDLKSSAEKEKEKMINEKSTLEQEIKKLKKDIKEKNEENELLVSKNQELIEHANVVNNAFQQSEKKIVDANNKIKNLDLNIKLLESTNKGLENDLNKKINEYNELYKIANEKIDELKSKEKEIERFINEIERLGNENKSKTETFKTQYEELQNEKNDKEQEIKALKTNINELKESIGKKEEEEATLRKTIKENEGMIESKDAELNDIKQKLIETNKTNKALQKENEELRQNITDNKSKIEKNEEKITNIEKEIKEKERDIEEKEREIENKKREIESYIIINKDLHTQIDELKKGISNKEQEIKTLNNKYNSDIDLLKSENSKEFLLNKQLNSKIEEMEKNINKLNDDVKSKDTNIKTLKEISDQKDNEISKMTQIISKNEDEIKRLENEIKKLNEQKDDIDNQLEEAKNENMKLNYDLVNEIESLANKKNELQRQLDAANKTKSEIEDTNAKLKKLLTEHEANNNKLREELETSKQLHEELEKKFKAIQAENEKMKIELSETKRKCLATINILKQKNAKLETELQKAKQQNTEEIEKMSKDLNESNNKIKQLNAMIDELKVSVDKLNEENINLKRDIGDADTLKNENTNLKNANARLDAIINNFSGESDDYLNNSAKLINSLVDCLNNMALFYCDMLKHYRTNKSKDNSNDRTNKTKNDSIYRTNKTKNEVASLSQSLSAKQNNDESTNENNVEKPPKPTISKQIRTPRTNKTKSDSSYGSIKSSSKPPSNTKPSITIPKVTNKPSANNLSSRKAKNLSGGNGNESLAFLISQGVMLYDDIIKDNIDYSKVNGTTDDILGIKISNLTSTFDYKELKSSVNRQVYVMLDPTTLKNTIGEDAIRNNGLDPAKVDDWLAKNNMYIEDTFYKNKGTKKGMPSTSLADLKDVLQHPKGDNNITSNDLKECYLIYIKDEYTRYVFYYLVNFCNIFKPCKDVKEAKLLYNKTVLETYKKFIDDFSKSGLIIKTFGRGVSHYFTSLNTIYRNIITILINILDNSIAYSSKMYEAYKTRQAEYLQNQLQNSIDSKSLKQEGSSILNKPITINLETLLKYFLIIAFVILLIVILVKSLSSSNRSHSSIFKRRTSNYILI